MPRRPIVLFGPYHLGSRRSPAPTLCVPGDWHWLRPAGTRACAGSRGEGRRGDTRGAEQALWSAGIDGGAHSVSALRPQGRPEGPGTLLRDGEQCMATWVRAGGSRSTHAPSSPLFSSQKIPFYRIFVADSRCPRDGKHLEIVGHYDPLPGACREGCRASYVPGCAEPCRDSCLGTACADAWRMHALMHAGCMR